MKTEIRSKVSKIEELNALYGMGSFFNGGIHRDIDLVAVIDCTPDMLLMKADIVREACRTIEWGSPQPVDVTILTPLEFSERPLRDFNTLIPLFQRDVS